MILVLAAASVVTGCGSGPSPGGDGLAVLSPEMTWQWQLQGTVNTGYDVDLYDIDLFDNDDALIDSLHADGRVVICYFSAGSWEEWREDATSFTPTDIGNGLDGWAGERWLDIRSADVMDVMAARLDRADDIGCDGVEPDNVGGYEADTGFDLGATDQLAFNRFLAVEAHGHGLLIGLKNDLEQIPDLVDDFDFALNEECFAYDECDAYRPFLDAQKLVLNAEYAEQYLDDRTDLCSQAGILGTRTLVLPVALDDSFRLPCNPI